MLLPAPFGPMMEVSAPRRKLALIAVQGDEAAEALAHGVGAQDHVGPAHRARPASSVPQMPRGKNSTQATKARPTSSCQCTVYSDTRFSSSRNTPAPTNGPKKVPMPPSSAIITARPDVS